jgi:hypothetical protein
MRIHLPTKPAAALIAAESTEFEGSLRSRHRTRRPYRQLQHPAQRGQILVPWSNAIGLPKIDARRADADHFGYFGDRQATLDPSVSEMTGKVRLARQWGDPFALGSGT